MSMLYEFKCLYPSWVHNFDNEMQITIVEGSTGNKIQREKLEDNVDGNNLVYDSQSDKIFKRQNRLICIQGSLDNEMYWDQEDIKSSDVDRLKELWANDKIRNGVYTESETEEAISNKKFCSSYQFNCDYDVLSPMSQQWNLAVPGIMKATSMRTRMFCMLTDHNDYEIKILDIRPGDLKVLEKDKTKDHNYVFFSQRCTLRNGAGTVEQYAVKRLESDSVDIRNKGDLTARIILITR